MLQGIAALMISQSVVPAAVGITQIQEKFYASTANATSHNITANSTPTNGNLMVLVVVTDDAATTPSGWTLALSEASNTNNYIYYKTAGPSESSTITVALGLSDTLAMYYVEVSGLTNVLDKTNGAIAQGGGGTIDSTTTATTTAANEFIIVMAGLWINTFTQSVTATNNSFSFRGSVSSSNGGGIDNVTVGVGTRIVSATGAYQSTLTLSGALGTNNTGMIATFK